MITQKKKNFTEANDLSKTADDAPRSSRSLTNPRNPFNLASIRHRFGGGAVVATIVLALTVWGCNSSSTPQPIPGDSDDSSTQFPGGVSDGGDGSSAIPGADSGGTGDADTVVVDTTESKAPDMPAMDDDADGDGVMTYMDSCPTTPPGAELIDGGCSAVDIVLAPEVVFDSVARAIDESTEVLATGEDFLDAAQQLTDVKSSIETTILRIRAGEVCEQSQSAQAVDSIGLIRFDLGTRIVPSVINRIDLGLLHLGLANNLEFATRAKLSPMLLPGLISLFDNEEELEAEGDSPALFSRAFIGLGLTLVDRAEQAADNAQAILDEICEAETNSIRLQGVIVRIDDARRTLELGDGTFLALAEREHSQGFSEGQEVFIDADMFRDGTGIARNVELAYSEEVNDAIVGALNECLKLRFAPIQPFPFNYGGPYTLHSPFGYRHTDGNYWLEQGMRFAVVPGPCAGIGQPAQSGPDSILKFTRYSMKIDLSWVQNGQLAKVTVASDLDPSDAPVPFTLPLGVRSWMNAWLKTTTRQQECVRSLSSMTCGDFEMVDTNSFPLIVRQRGGFAEAQYESTKFDLEDDDMTSLRPARVANVVLGAGAGNASFEAKGWLVNGNASSRDQGQLRTIKQGDSFAIYNEDIIDDYLFPMDTLGVDTRSGLIWPKVKGTRNSQAYSYSCRIPKALVRDVVNFCPSTVPSTPGVPVPFPDESYYRLPFNPGTPIWVMGHGNWRADGAGHCGTAGFEQCLQRFAFDFGGPEGTDILAARGGVVTSARGESDINAWQCGLDRKACYENGGTNCATKFQCDIGNYTFIRHQDGSYGVYWHFEKDGVYVSPGQVVHRGDAIGACGNTGNSTGPHLHFHVQESPNIDGGFSIPVLFETAAGECDRIDNHDPLLPTQ